MMLGIGVEKAADHALILRVVLRRLTLEKFDAPLAQCKRDFDALFT